MTEEFKEIKIYLDLINFRLNNIETFLSNLLALKEDNKEQSHVD